MKKQIDIIVTKIQFYYKNDIHPDNKKPYSLEFLETLDREKARARATNWLIEYQKMLGYKIDPKSRGIAILSDFKRFKRTYEVELPNQFICEVEIDKKTRNRRKVNKQVEKL